MGVIDSLLHLAVAASAAALIPAILEWGARGDPVAARALIVAAAALAVGLLAGKRGVLWAAAAAYFGALVLHGVPPWIFGVALGMTLLEVWSPPVLERMGVAPATLVVIATALLYYPFSLQVNVVLSLYYLGLWVAPYFERRRPNHLFVSLGKILVVAAAAKLTLVAPEVAFLAVMGSIVVAFGLLVGETAVVT